MSEENKLETGFEPFSSEDIAGILGEETPEQTQPQESSEAPEQAGDTRVGQEAVQAEEEVPGTTATPAETEPSHADTILARYRAERERLETKASEKSLREQVQEEVLAEMRQLARENPTALLSDKLGIEQEHLGHSARHIWESYRGDEADPEFKEKFDRLKERDSVRSEIGQLRQEIQVQQANAKAAQYMTDMVSAVSDEHSYVNKLIGQNRDVAMKALEMVATGLYEQTGRVVDPADVVRIYDENIRAELEETANLYKDELLAILGNEPKPTKQATKPEPKTLSSSTSVKSSKPRTQSDDEYFDELIKIATAGG